MGVTFTQAPLVAPGDPLRSRDLVGLTRAFADRLRSGLADGVWRIGYWWLSPWRQVRNPDASGFLFPPVAEFLETYSHIPAGDALWPEAGPGEPEGANVASQMMGFIFGLEAAGIEPEDLRLTDPEGGGIPIWLGTRPPATPAEYWTLAKYQRGAYDPRTGALSTGALWIAQSHAYLQPGSRSMHGYQFGGYLPSPAIGSSCAPPADGSPTPINWQWIFTNTETGASLTYGSCPEDPAALAGGTPYYTLDNIVLFVNDGTIVVLPKSQWIDGPYTGNPRLRKIANGAYERAMNSFAADFRGPNQRPDEWQEEDGWNDEAFDFQRFFTSQYLLAPAYGSDLGGDVIVPVYPRFRTTSQLPAIGSALRNQNGAGDLHTIAPGFCAGSALVTAVKLTGPTAVEVLLDGTAVAKARLSPDTTGAASVIVTWDTAYAGAISFRISEPCALDSGGYIEAELAELLQYKPQVRDVYVLLRIGGIDFGGPTDGSGLDFDRAAEIGDAYFATGCALSLLGHPGMEGSLAEANRNAVLDAMRRLSRSVRMIRGDDVLGYAVESGKSVLWCRRYVAGLGTGVQADMWEGIVDAIAHKAPPGGSSNEWLMTADFKALRYADGSIWKPDSYGRYWALNNRCHLLDPDIANDPTTRWHFAYGQRLVSPPAVLLSEAPSGYTYATTSTSLTAHINTKVCGDPVCEATRADFYSSCRIYEPPPEIERAETVTLADGVQAVKLTFTTRFHAHSTAPASIDYDRSTWVIADVQGESYRTWENAIREFLLWRDSGLIPSLKTGDWSQNYVAGGLADQPWASIFPELTFVQLPREPYIDADDTPDSNDTPLWSDEFTRMEIYLHAMAPGYIDGKTSLDYACTYGTTGAFDFSFEALCYQAFGRRWFTTLPTVATDYTDEVDTRPDGPQGFGPLPNTQAAAETFNQFAAAVNLLTTVRVMLPAELETNTGTRTNQYSVDPFNAAGDSVAATGVQSTSLGSDYAVWIDTVPTEGGTLSWSGWSGAGAFFGATKQATLLATGATSYVIQYDEAQVKWRWTLLDPDAVNAIPPAWQSMLEDNGAVLASEEVVIEPLRRKYMPFDNGRQCHDGLVVADTVWNGAPGHQAWDFDPINSTTVTCGEFPVAGILVAPTLPYSTHWASDMVSTNPANYCNSGPTSARTLTPINKDTILVRVPLVPAPTP